MSHPTVPLDLPARASDWLNPILVKETRQALKSRQFLATFLLMLVAAWLISVFGTVYAGPGAAYRPIGGGFFVAYYVVLSVAIFVVVPFGAFRSLLAERDLHTWEVLSITTLKPRQIVWGKLTSALVQLFIYYSAITPFIAFANLLKGIDVPTIAFVLIASVFWSMALSLLALTASTFGTQKYWQVFLTLAVVGGLLMGLYLPIGIASMGIWQGALPFDRPEFWWIVGLIASYLLAYGFLCIQIAVSQLTFDADNRSTGIRIAAAGVFWLSVVWVGGWSLLGGTWGLPSLGASVDVLEFLAVVGTLHWTAVGLFAATESDTLSRRIRRSLSRLGLGRVLLAPLIPGGGRGLIYVLFHVSFMVIFLYGLAWHAGTVTPEFSRFISALWCYFVIYIGLGAAIGRGLRSLFGEFRPSHVRVVIALMFALGAILPQTLNLLDSVLMSRPDRALYFVSDPFTTLEWLTRPQPDANLVVLVLAGGAMISLLLNLRAMLAGLTDAARVYVPLAPALPREADSFSPPLQGGAGGVALPAE